MQTPANSPVRTVPRSCQCLVRGMSALSLDLAIFAILSGAALVEYGVREARAERTEADYE